MEQSEDQPLQREGDIYKRIRLLGSGSYGRAFLVREVATGQQWAVKQVDLADLSPQEQADAMREAKILELLRHPNIIRFREVYRTAKGRLNMVMEYAQGGDLSQRIRKAKQSQTPFSQDQVLSWFVQVCLAVRHLHDSKVIHRDLKPQNIFLTGDDMVKVGDFGVSRLMENTVARARTVVGSPYYLSPEIVENRPYSFKTDIWSLGTLLFEMCALQPPFSAGSLQALALKIVQGGYAQPPRQYSQGLRGLIKWMLQTKEANRPSIHQLLLSPVIATRINRFIADSQTVLSPSPRMQFKLKPPPDLLALEGIENKSEVVFSKRWDEGKQDKEEESPARGKAKTPQVAVRKGPNNFMYRPVSGKRKVEAPGDLADLIQIKPSLLQAHEKPERMVLPKVPPPKSSQVYLPKPKSQPIREREKEREKEKPVTSPPVSAFVKKRTSFTQAEGGTKREEVRSAVNPGKRSEKRPLPNEKEKPQKEKPQKEKPLVIIQKEKKKAITNAPKPQIRKKISKPPSQGKLEICSEQVKKKDAKVQKKPVPKKQKSQKKPMLPAPPKLQQAMEQQKCNWQQQKNSNPSSYYNDSFQSYSSGSDLGQELNLSLSDTLSPTPTSNFRNMLKQMEDIRAALEQGPDTLPAAGQSIPQLLEYSNYPRVDDEEEPPPPSVVEKQDAFPQSQLQSLRINLQEIFGVENIIYAYHTIESKMGEVGLALNQPEIIAEIMAGRPQMQEATLQAYFRLIVTIVGMEMGLL